MVPRLSRPSARHSLPELSALHGDPGLPAGRAALSACGAYRWWLERLWDPDRPRILFVGLNPSRADARSDDPTLRRVMGFARRWGFGGVEVLNLFARISSRPAILRRSRDPVGSEGDQWLVERLMRHAGRSCRSGVPDPGPVWVGWGNGGSWMGRNRQVLGMIETLGLGLGCLGVTALGHPRHPLYRPSDLRLTPYRPTYELGSASLDAPCPALPVATPST